MSAGISDTGKIGFLDNVRLNNGNDCLKNYFYDLLMNNTEKAAELVNDEDLHYFSLYLLRQELETFGLESLLNERNRTALRITKDIEAGDSEDMGLMTRGNNIFTGMVLRWMLGTGYPDDGHSGTYDTVMDHAAIQLSRTYGDTGLLGEIAEMIFTRNRKGFFVHNLIWAFFEAHSPDSLILIANRLCSMESSDVELAKRLLCFIPAVSESRDADTEVLYREAAEWIQKNRLNMLYTGESLHQAVKPEHYHLPEDTDRAYRPDATGGESPHPPDAKIKLDEIKLKYTEGSIERKIVEKLAGSQKDIRYDSEEELRFELDLRKRIIDASMELYRGRLRFRTFREAECNEDFWELMENGGFRLRNDVRPSEGINDIFRNTRRYGTECATAIMMVFYRAVLLVFREELFDKTFPEIILMNWLYTDNKMGVSTYRNPEVYLPADCRYFRNPDVDPMTPEWQGENAIDLGDGTYYGHGIGIRDEETMIRVLNKFRVKGSDVSAYLTKTVTLPDFKGLFRIYSKRAAPEARNIPARRRRRNMYIRQF